MEQEAASCPEDGTAAGVAGSIDGPAAAAPAGSPATDRMPVLMERRRCNPVGVDQLVAAASSRRMQ